MSCLSTSNIFHKERIDKGCRGRVTDRVEFMESGYFGPLRIFRDKLTEILVADETVAALLHCQWCLVQTLFECVYLAAGMEAGA